MAIASHRWAFTIGHGMPAQRIETNMFAFPSHHIEIFLEFHSEIEGKEIHSEWRFTVRDMNRLFGVATGFRKN